MDAIRHIEPRKARHADFDSEIFERYVTVIADAEINLRRTLLKKVVFPGGFGDFPTRVVLVAGCVLRRLVFLRHVEHLRRESHRLLQGLSDSPRHACVAARVLIGKRRIRGVGSGDLDELAVGIVIEPNRHVDAVRQSHGFGLNDCLRMTVQQLAPVYLDQFTAITLPASAPAQLVRQVVCEEVGAKLTTVDLQRAHELAVNLIEDEREVEHGFDQSGNQPVGSLQVADSTVRDAHDFRAVDATRIHAEQDVPRSFDAGVCQANDFPNQRLTIKRLKRVEDQ